ncbi:MAG: ferric reductase-like transmembrane domain-containing protein [Myxococcales bacterium]|nr:ferric reductase-like transmembrane domain-containing protein [Myxococcales bacterium]
MSVSYTGVSWTPSKKRYDLVIGLGVALMLAAFALTGALVDPLATAETLVLRALSWTAVALLHVILAIGPLARLDPRLLPLLYNRRHLGVSMFVLGLAHAAFATAQFHALGDRNPLVSALAGYAAPGVNPRWTDLPFEPLGFLALVILFLMAATSHDFWLKLLGASIWKSLHSLVYVAYGLVLAHVALGIAQSGPAALLTRALLVGAACLTALHLVAYLRERRFDRGGRPPAAHGFVPVARLSKLADGQGRPIVVGGQRLALFRVGDAVHCVHGVCRHQGGPLGEGAVIDGCITCPWHGWQYRPEDGCSPPPFQEVVHTYPVRVEEDIVYVSPTPNPLATPAAAGDHHARETDATSQEGA